ncbi:hypothetical protein ACGFZP_27510 [Kitasatospora sp. NPDC048239]|uniref:hypothetical protein n=1 Tax=Kitasatospora sp. NPDC048239 TaxID=3364046 RepID=UPI0037131459
MDLGLQQKVYVLTGATRGLGVATARQLVEGHPLGVLRSVVDQTHADEVTKAPTGGGRAAGAAGPSATTPSSTTPSSARSATPSSA